MEHAHEDDERPRSRVQASARRQRGRGRSREAQPHEPIRARPAAIANRLEQLLLEGRPKVRATVIEELRASLAELGDQGPRGDTRAPRRRRGFGRDRRLTHGGHSRERGYAAPMPTLSSRMGSWELDHLMEWSKREQVIRAPAEPIVHADTKVATIGSCFAEELAEMMGEVGISGAMHPAGLFYSSATVRQELERIAGWWQKRAEEPAWPIEGGVVDPFRDHRTIHRDEAALDATRTRDDAAADKLFKGAGVVVVTLGLIETWRNPETGNVFRQIPHPAVFPNLGAEFHRLTVSEMLDDLERIRHVIREVLGAEMVITTSPVPLHATFTGLDVRVANTESKSRIRAATSEFVDRHPDVHYFHSYEMVVTAERQSDYYREDGRHVHRHAVRYIISEFLRLFADPSLHLTEVDSSWLTPIEKTAAAPAPDPLPRRLVRRVRRELARRA